MEHTESELYTLKNQFYSHQHQKVIAYSLDQFSENVQLSVLSFQIRSTVSLGKDASPLIDDGKTKFPESEALFQLLQAWNDLHSFGTDDSTYFNDVETPTTALEAVLTAIYLVKVGKNIDQAIQILTTYIDSNPSELEPFLLLVQLYLVKGNFTSALKIFNDFQLFSSDARDSIIYLVLESWIHSIKGESDNISNAYYFYDDLLSGDFDDDSEGKFKLLISVFVLTLQLKHYPEAQELLIQIASLSPKPNADFIANQITADYLMNNGSKVGPLLEELASVDPDHQLMVELKEKNQLFDEIVSKYKVES